LVWVGLGKVGLVGEIKKKKRAYSFACFVFLVFIGASPFEAADTEESKVSTSNHHKVNSNLKTYLLISFE